MRALKIALLGAALIAAQPATGAEKVKVSVSVIAGAFAMYFIAIDRGYFAEEDLDVEIVGAAGPTATAALMSGDLGFSSSGGAAVPAILRGAPLKVVMVSNDRPPYQLWSGDDKIKTIDDLKGKRIGVISTGDTHEFALRLLFMSRGMDPNGFIYVPIGPGAGRMAGVSSGSLSAASITMDEAQQMQTDPKAHLVIDTSKFVKMINGGMATSDKMMTSERGTAKKFMRGLIKGRRYVAAFEDEAVNAIAKRNAAMSREAITDGLRISLATATADGTIPEETQKLEISLRATQLNLPPDKVAELDKVFDFSLIKEVNRELDEKGWTPIR